MNRHDEMPASGKIKLVAIDLDGTLLDSHDSVSEANKEAIRRAAALGVIPVIASGRIREEGQFVVDSLPEIRYFIGMNGGLVEDLQTGAVLQDHPFDEEVARRILDRLDAAGFFYQIYARGGVYCPVHWMCRLQESGMSAPYLKMFAASIREWPPGGEKSIPVYKLLAVAQTPDKAAILRDSIHSCADAELVCSFPGLGYHEILPPGIDKSHALSFLCRHLNVDRREVLGIGDSENDAKMLRYAGYSAMVGNAAPMLRDIVGYVARTNDDDGVADAIHRYIFK